MVNGTVGVMLKCPPCYLMLIVNNQQSDIDHLTLSLSRIRAKMEGESKSGTQ